MQITLRDKWRTRSISKAVHGYSDARHYTAFREILTEAKPSSLLVLGVYFGRDICFFLDIAKRLRLPLSITGVDKFSDDACEDWPQGKRDMNWQQAGFGNAPSVEGALLNVAKFGNVT